MAIVQLSNRLGCPEPIPTVVLFAARTIALDLTNRQILNAKIKFLTSLTLGFRFDTILKSLAVNLLISSEHPL